MKYGWDAYFMRNDTVITCTKVGIAKIEVTAL